MSLTKTASDYLAGNELSNDIKTNRIYKMFELNGYDPAYAGSVLYG